MRFRKRYITANKSSSTLDAVLAYVYRKEDLLRRCGNYANTVVDGLVDLGLVKKVTTKKDTFFFKTDKAQNFKAIDFAKEFLWAYHNSIDRQIQNTKRFILCFDKDLPNGCKLVEIEEAVKKGYV